MSPLVSNFKSSVPAFADVEADPVRIFWISSPPSDKLTEPDGVPEKSSHSVLDNKFEKLEPLNVLLPELPA